MKKIILLLTLVLLAPSSMFCQTGEVWSEIRGTDTLIVMTPAKGRDISHKLVNRQELADSVTVLSAKIHAMDSLVQNCDTEKSLIQGDLDGANAQITVLNKRIETKDETNRVNEILLNRKDNTKWRWLSFGGAGGFVTGVLAALGLTLV